MTDVSVWWVQVAGTCCFLIGCVLMLAALLLNRPGRGEVRRPSETHTLASQVQLLAPLPTKRGPQ